MHATSDGPGSEKRPSAHEQPAAQPDTGLRQLLIYILVALVIVVLLAVLAVNLVTRWWGPQP